MNIQQDLSNLEAFQHEGVNMPTHDEIVSKIELWVRYVKRGDILDMFPVSKHLSDAGKDRLRLHIIYLALIYTNTYKELIHLIMETCPYKTRQQVIGL